jgi:site-specific DNA-methyltransferase (adenine-specific)
MRYSIRKIDAVDLTENLPSGSVQVVMEDIAYESLEKHRKIGTTTRLTGNWFEIFPNSRIPELLAERYRVLASDGHFYFFCDDETRDVVVPMAKAAGFHFWNAIVWDKVNIGMGYHYRKSKEYILFFDKKGKSRQLEDKGMSDVWRIPSLRGNRLIYPTAKPLELYNRLISQSAREGDIVLDGFCGCANSGVAAILANVDYIGGDLSQKAYDLARKRLGTAVAVAAANREQQT